MHSGYFIPTASEWRMDSVIFPTMRNKSNVRFRFQNRSGEGNNIYIDDINITIYPVGLEEPGVAEKELSVFPNPSSGPVTVRFFTNGRNTVRLQVQDMAGRDIEEIYSGNLNGGSHEFTFGGKLSAGIYFVRLHDDDGVKVRRFLVTR
jgi:hypothetical protein